MKVHVVSSEYEPLKDIIDKAINSNIGISNMLEIVANLSNPHVKVLLEQIILYSYEKGVILWTAI